MILSAKTVERRVKLGRIIIINHGNYRQFDSFSTVILNDPLEQSLVSAFNTTNIKDIFRGDPTPTGYAHTIRYIKLDDVYDKTLLARIILAIKNHQNILQ